tara:strand:+ start:127 stop:234 length:108 start_codon:yes stop_codon:yes gene_type:complete
MARDQSTSHQDMDRAVLMIVAAEEAEDLQAVEIDK